MDGRHIIYLIFFACVFSFQPPSTVPSISDTTRRDTQPARLLWQRYVCHTPHRRPCLAFGALSGDLSASTGDHRDRREKIWDISPARPAQIVPLARSPLSASLSAIRAKGSCYIRCLWNND